MSAAIRARVTRIIASLVLICACTLSPQTDAEPRGGAAAAYERGDYANAFRLLLPLANAGDANAQGLIGSMYLEGRGVAKDAIEGAKWYRKAAEQGDVGAQAMLGSLYDHGVGVKKDHAEAVKWYRRSADQGDELAQHTLAVSYAIGEGITQSYAEASKWFRKAANQGYARSQVNLGLMYADGKGVPQDYVEAYKWFSIALSQFPASSEEAIKILKYIELIRAKMAGPQITEAQRRALEWRPIESARSDTIR